MGDNGEMQPQGLSTSQAQAYLKTGGYNEIVEKKPSLLAKLLKQSASPISAMLLFAAVLSLVAGKTFDFSFILVLLVLNVGITVWQEHKADTAIQKLNEHLSLSIGVLRDNAWVTLPSRFLVPHDLIELRSGNVIPADARVVSANAASSNEAALTGESLPKEKKAGDALYSGAFVSSGLVTAEVTATGNNTSFGKVISHIDAKREKSSLEKDIIRISRFLSVLSIVAALSLTWMLLVHQAPLIEILRLDLSLIIAGIPISLPTVMTLIIAFGVIALAKKNVVVRRLSSLEDLANTDLLLTDKTGTLTKNKITVNEVIGYGTWEREKIAGLVVSMARNEPDTDINQAILALKSDAPKTAVVAYTPGDSTRKRNTLQFIDENGEKKVISLGAPQVISGLCVLPDEIRARFEKDVQRLAERGYRTLALSMGTGEHESNMELIGILALSDELREDAASVVQFLTENGIKTVMVTGDNRLIAKEIAGKLSIPGTDIISRDELLKTGFDSIAAGTFVTTQAFAEILPEDKYKLVTVARKFYSVASNGDGVNDLPAVKAASIGFAVKNAVDALKGAADIVLLSDGIGVMRDAFLEGRKIFARLYSYSMYRISESFRLIVTIAVLGFLTGTYPLSPLQIILIALLNDMPIISLAFDRVRVANRPSKINVREQFTKSLLFGLVGVANSLILYFFALDYLHLSWPVVQTLFFLKLTVSGHLLIYVAHTSERWYRYLPSREVIIATALTQALATALAMTGLFMPAAVSWQMALFIWVWSFFFMQISELVKRPLPKPLPEATDMARAHS